MVHSVVSGEVKFIRIFAGDHPSEGVKVRHSDVNNENWTNNQPQLGNGAR